MDITFARCNRRENRRLPAIADARKIAHPGAIKTLGVQKLTRISFNGVFEEGLLKDKFARY